MPAVELVVLGSGGVMPTRERLTSSFLLADWNGYTIILDAGEGAQLNLARSGKSVHDIDAIALTHDHGDHVNGVAGLLQSMAVSKRTTPLLILGPPSAVDFVSDVLEAYEARLGFPVEYARLEGRGTLTLYERGGDSLVLSWDRTCHTRDSVGFRLEWRLRPRIDRGRLRELGVPPGPWIRRLLEEGEAEAPGGVVVRRSDIARPGGTLTVAYSGDTAPCETMARLAERADLLVHEATYTSDMSEEALERLHSSSIHAALVARKAEARSLLLFHASPRYRGLEARRIEAEARLVFPRSIMAWDLMRLRIAPLRGTL